MTTIREHLESRVDAIESGELSPLEIIRFVREDEPGIARVELLLGFGGPTDRIIWDRRGAGWSEYSHTDCEPATITLDERTWAMVDRTYAYDV